MNATCLQVGRQETSSTSLPEICHQQLLQNQLQLHSAWLLCIAGIFLLQLREYLLQPHCLYGKTKAALDVVLQLLAQKRVGALMASCICGHFSHSDNY